MIVLQIIGLILMVIGAVFAAIGVYGIYAYKDFYARATIASLIDSTGFLCISIGLVFYKGFSTFSFKTLFLIMLVLLLNPLANHFVVRGAHTSGYRSGKGR